MKQETTNPMTKEQIQKSELKSFADLLKSNGFTVIVSAKHPFKWLFFEKDGQLGTVGANYFGGYDFTTVHHGCRECGTGFGVTEMSDLTIENANKCFVIAPNWATKRDRAAIRKYKDVDSFINNISNKWAEYYIY